MKTLLTVRKTGIRNNNLDVEFRTVEKLDLSRASDLEYLDNDLFIPFLEDIDDVTREEYAKDITRLYTISKTGKHANDFIIILSDKGYLYSWEFAEYTPKLTVQQKSKLMQLRNLYNNLYDLAVRDDDFNELLVDSDLFPHSLDELAENVQPLLDKSI